MFKLKLIRLFIGSSCFTHPLIPINPDDDATQSRQANMAKIDFPLAMFQSRARPNGRTVPFDEMFLLVRACILLLGIRRRHNHCEGLSCQHVREDFYAGVSSRETTWPRLYCSSSRRRSFSISMMFVCRDVVGPCKCHLQLLGPAL